MEDDISRVRMWELVEGVAQEAAMIAVVLDGMTALESMAVVQRGGGRSKRNLHAVSNTGFNGAGDSVPGKPRGYDRLGSKGVRRVG